MATIDDDQATRLADGWEIIVGMLSSLEKRASEATRRLLQFC
jgi:hypothetical protein